MDKEDAKPIILEEAVAFIGTIAAESRTKKGYCRNCGWVSGHRWECPTFEAQRFLDGESE